MKIRNLLLIISMALVITACGEDKEVLVVQERNGLVYEVNKIEPFTGKHITHWPNGQKKEEYNYKDGKISGVTNAWYYNGQKLLEMDIVGKENGKRTTWYENGQKKSVANYKNEKQEGIAINWYENGQKQHEKNYKDGKQDGAMIAWNEKGQKIINVIQERNDLVYGVNQHEPFTGLYVKKYKNGQKKLEVNVKDGKRDGLEMTWDENGKKMVRRNFVDGKVEGKVVVWDKNGQTIAEIIFKDGKLFKTIKLR